MSWGTSSYGLSVWGTAVLPAPAVLSAIATSERTVEVRLSSAALANSQIGRGDALNPQSWDVRDFVSGETFHVIAVRKISADTFELYTLFKFGNFKVIHLVDATAVLKSTGIPYGSPTTFQFLGCAATRRKVQPSHGVDIANPPFDTNGRPGGTLRVGSSGDYDDESGLDFYRKIIIRRLTTLPGGFFHMPDYGLGLRLKEQLPINDMVRLQAQIELELAREPEFQSVHARLSLSTSGVLLIEVQVRLTGTGAQLVVPVQVAAPRVQL